MITLYHEVTYQPVTIARLMRDEVLVQRYRKPAMLPSGLHIPLQAQLDKTQTLWEVLLSNERAEEHIGMPLTIGAIVQTLRRWPVDTHLVTKEDEHAFLLSVSKCGIRGIITYSSDDEEEDDAAAQ